MKETIYVALLHEGVEVWRPVEAVHERDDVYSIVSVNPDLEDEHCSFARGIQFAAGKKLSRVVQLA